MTPSRQAYIIRPDWADIYKDYSHEPDRDNELVSITLETARLARNALRAKNAEDYYANSGAAERELKWVIAAYETGFQPEDYAHTAQLLRSDNDKIADAACSNNRNVILAALDIMGKKP